MEDNNSILENLKNFLETDEGKESIKRFRERMDNEEEHSNRWVERFRKWAVPDMDFAIEKLTNWYYSDKYRNREYSKGCEPRESLLWVALNFARENCRECDDEKYLNMFTGEAYYIGSYVIQVMHGQGSVIRIDKIEEPIKASRKERMISIIESRIKTEMDKHSRSQGLDWIKIAAAKVYREIEEFNKQ